MIDNIKLAASFAHTDKSNVFSNILVSSGIVTAQNEIVGISLEIDVDVDFCCNAKQLVSALNNCELSDVKMTIKNNKLYIVSGRFKSNIPIIEIDSYPRVNQSGIPIDIQHDIIGVMNGITQFTDPNDVRAALRGIELAKNSVNATNGHVAIKKEIDEIVDFESVVIPSKSINMMAKVNAHIDTISGNGHLIFFNFNDGYLFTKIIDQKMPDIGRILSGIEEKTELSLIADAVKSMNSMCDTDRTIILSDEIKTKSGNASISGFNIKECAFNSDYLLKIIEVADSIDFTKYPSACPFEGDGLQGAVVGVIT